MGVGLGGGGALDAMKSSPLGKGLKTSLGRAYKNFSEKIITKSSSENTYISVNCPRFLYKFLAEMG